MKKIIFSLLLTSTISLVQAQIGRRTTGSLQPSEARTENRTIPSSGRSLAPSSNFNRAATHSIPNNSEWRNMNPSQRRATVKNLTTVEKNQLIQNIKKNIMIDEIKVKEEHQEEFQKIFEEYNNSQNSIKESFRDNKSKKIEALSDEEARLKLNQSFEVGQKLIENRKAYATKFLQFLTPQQVLKLFQTEGKVRDKVIDKKYTEE